MELKMKKVLVAVFALVLGCSLPSLAVISSSQAQTATEAEEWDPNAANAEDILRQYVEDNAQEFIETDGLLNPSLYGDLLMNVGGCYRESCSVYVYVSIEKQRLYLYVNGQRYAKWKISSGLLGPTRRWDSHPHGPIRTKYTSKKFPGGDWNGLGNMPYAVFYKGGFAIHGTPEANWKKLGQPASHGCIRLHPENARILNGFVREVGLNNTWFTIQ